MSHEPVKEKPKKLEDKPKESELEKINKEKLEAARKQVKDTNPGYKFPDEQPNKPKADDPTFHPRDIKPKKKK